MRKMVVAVLAALVAAGAVAAPAEAAPKKKKKPKKVERSAEASYTGAAAVAYGSIGGNNFGGAAFPSGSKEHYVSIEVKDQTGTPVSGVVGQDLNGDMALDESTPFCGKTAEPVAIEGGTDVTVILRQGPCGGSPAAVTTGSIVATFSNLP